MKKLAIIAISAMTAFTGIAPAQAFPIASAPKIESAAPGSDNLQQVQYWRHRHGDHRWGGMRGSWGRDRHDYRGRYYRDGYYRDRYYRRHHHGSNAGAIIGGLAAGAIIGGALAQPRYAGPRYVGGNSHVEWCYNRYRSYRASDNTFQPNHGPRRQCRSPY